MGKVRKLHNTQVGVEDHYRWIFYEGEFKMVHPVKLGTRKGMCGQIIPKASATKELAFRHLITDKNQVPIAYRHIGISAVEYKQIKEKAAV